MGDYLVIILFVVGIPLILLLFYEIIWKYYGNKKKSTNGRYTATKELYNFCCDEKSRVWWNKKSPGTPKIHKFDDVLDFELIADGNTLKSKSEIESALINGEFLVSAANMNMFSSLCIKVYIKGGGFENLVYLQENVNTDHDVYKIAIERARQTVNMLSRMAAVK